MTKKRDFSNMTRQELKQHVLANREDDEAFEYLIKTFDDCAPKRSQKETEEAFKELLESLKDEGKNAWSSSHFAE